MLTFSREQIINGRFEDSIEGKKVYGSLNSTMPSSFKIVISRSDNQKEETETLSFNLKPIEAEELISTLQNYVNECKGGGRG